VAALLAALGEAGFPAPPGPGGALVPDATVRTLTVEAAGITQEISLTRDETRAQPGYGVAFDILDGVIRQLSGDAVPYKSAQPQIVSAIAELAR
jgi:hypothetical protein